MREHTKERKDLFLSSTMYAAFLLANLILCVCEISVCTLKFIVTNCAETRGAFFSNQNIIFTPVIIFKIDGHDATTDGDDDVDDTSRYYSFLFSLPTTAYHKTFFLVSCCIILIIINQVSMVQKSAPKVD